MIRISDNTLKVLSELGDHEARRALLRIDRLVQHSERVADNINPQAYYLAGHALWVSPKPLLKESHLITEKTNPHDENSLLH